MRKTAGVKSGDSKSEFRIAEELRSVLGRDAGDWEILASADCREEPLVWFLDGIHSGSAAKKLGPEIKKATNATFLLLPEDAASGAFESAWVDDVLLWPFRKLDVVGKLRNSEQVLLWNEVTELNTSFRGLLAGLKEDLDLAEKIQKSKLPQRFPEIPGFGIAARYLAGMRSGGDHFDLAENKEKSQLSVLLSDASSYGLSSALLTVVMRVLVKLSSESENSSLEAVKLIFEELQMSLREKDRLSLFFGSISRETQIMRYVNLGSSRVFLRRAGSEAVDLLPVLGEPLSKNINFPVMRELELKLSDKDRLIWLSDGVWESLGGELPTMQLLAEYRDRERVDLVNELVYRVKDQLGAEDDLPEQDCTVTVLDIDGPQLMTDGLKTAGRRLKMRVVR